MQQDSFQHPPLSEYQEKGKPGDVGGMPSAEASPLITDNVRRVQRVAALIMRICGYRCVTCPDAAQHEAAA